VLGVYLKKQVYCGKRDFSVLKSLDV